MKSIVPRKPLFNNDFDFELNWTGDLYRSNFFNTISMSFPVGEKWIIDTVRRGLESISESASRDDWRNYALDFISQEATHSRIHRKYNARLEALGLFNWWESKLQRQTKWGETGPTLNQVASSVTYEYLTALFCSALMRNPAWLSGATSCLSDLWLWHACEELEHKHFVLELYEAIGGGSLRRIVWFLRSAPRFLVQFQYQLVLNLWKQNALFKGKTLASAIVLNFGRGGLFWALTKGSLSFVNPWFEMKDGRGDTVSQRWLRNNRSLFSVLDRGRGSH